MRRIVIVCHVLPGTTLHDAVQDLCNLASETDTPVQANFNGQTLFVLPFQKASDVIGKIEQVIMVDQVPSITTRGD